MNVQPNKKKSKGRKGTKDTIPLPLEGTYSKPLDGTNSTTFLLTTNPGGIGASFQKKVRIIEASDDVRSSLQWVLDIGTVFSGTNATDVATQVHIVQSAASPAIYATFDRKLTSLGDQAYEAALTDAVATDVAQNDNYNQQLVIQNRREFYRNTEHVRESLFHAIGGMMPYQCLDRVKTYLTRHLTKPDDCPIRQFVGKLRHMNECELPHLPPRAANNSFTEDELKSIVWSAIPKEWGLEMQRQAFNRNEGTLEEMTNFLERYENYTQEMQALRFGSESEEEQDA